MRLGEMVIENEKKGFEQKNNALIRLKLNELIATYPSEVTEVLQKTDVPIKAGLPTKVIYAVVLKHIGKNAVLRDAIAKMLLEMDGYHNAVGWITVVGGALTAVSSVLSGIAQNKAENTKMTAAELEQQRMEMELQQAEEAAKRRRNGWFIVGGLVIGIGIIVLITRIIKENNTAKATLYKGI